METNTRKILARLARDKWVNQGGANHDIFKHPDRPGVIITVPRHREVSPMVARSIAKTARWI